MLEQSAALAAPAPDQVSIASPQAAALIPTYGYLAGAYQHLSLYDDADRWARTAVAFGERFGIPVAVAIGYEFLGEDAVSTGEWKEGLAYADREREIARRMHSRERLAWTHMHAALCAALLGDADRAERECREGIVLANAIDERRLGCLLVCYLGWGLAELGRLDEAEEVGREAIERAEALGLDHMRGEAWRCVAHIRIRQGRLDSALGLFEQTLAMLATSEAKAARLWIGPPHVETLLALGRRDEAREVLDAYAGVIAECQTPHFTREVARLRGLVAELPPPGPGAACCRRDTRARGDSAQSQRQWRGTGPQP